MTNMHYFEIKFEPDSEVANDKAYFLAHCTERLDELSKASEELRSDKEFMLSILNNLENYSYNNLFRYATEELRHDREFALACFSTGHLAPNDIVSCINNDKKVMAHYYPPEYQDDREIAFLLMCNLIHSYEAFVSKELCADVELAKAVYYERVKNKNYLDAYSLPEPMLDNEEILRLYIDDDYFASSKPYFYHVSERLRDDEDFVEYAALRNIESLCDASERLLTSKDFILRLLNKGIKVTYHMLIHRYMNNPLTDDEEIALLLLPNDPYYYQFLSRRLRAKKEIADIAINASGYQPRLYYAPEEFRDNLDYAYVLLKKGCEEEYKYMSKRIQAMPDIALLAMEQGLAMGHISKEAFLNMDKTTAMKAVNINKNVYPYLSEEVRNDEQITWNAYHNRFPNIYVKETWYEVMEYDYRVDYDPPVLLSSLEAIGPERKADYAFTEKMVDAFLQTKQAAGFTKEDLMRDYQAFYKRIDEIVWNNYREKKDIEYDVLKLDCYF